MHAAGRATSLTTAPLWYASRSSGIVAFIALTLALLLGIASTQRALAAPRWPRFATQHLHRNMSLIALALLLVHIVSTVMDGYVPISWVSTVLPFSSPYKRGGVALGAIAFDLIVVIVVSSLLRTRLPRRVWRRLHLAAYGLWPLSLLHFLVTGTDAKPGHFGRVLGIGALLVVVVVAGLRLSTRRQPVRRVASIP